ncbi:MAG TPA: ATPase, T2SS/T4P/T4SS family [Candidatus Margulisiibacteriota bacterium]|nr:ATPase, T2SS/T4P/T4SS family [Candidatus Margulisiibacteriota bacterium]
MDREIYEIDNEFLDRLTGKIFLLQDPISKREIMLEVFLEVYNLPKYQKIFRKYKNINMEQFFEEFLSYGIIDEFLDDPEVEDIMVSYLSPIYIHKAKLGMVKTDKRFTSREELDLFIKKLIVFSGRKSINKVNNVELANIKGRANIIYSPFGPQITITRAKGKPLSIIELVKSGSLNSGLAAQFWLYVEGMGIKPANIIISGGPGTGKTTLLNALMSFMPITEHLVVIEDTLELNTDAGENCARLESDEDLSLADLVKNSLRMRPDRIIVGEVRGSEAQDLMTAMNIGKYCLGTLHASTARETIIRMENEPMNVPSALINLVDVLVIMRRYNLNNKISRVVGELVETGGMEQKTVLLAGLWSYDFAKHDFVESNVSSIYRDRLAQISGKSPWDINQELKVRKKVIEAMLQKGIENFQDVTDFCRRYAADSQGALQELGLVRSELLK